MNPAQFGTLNTSKDYNTGYRHHYYDMEIPDRQPDEPHNIRVQAQEQGPNRWTIRAHAGPHEEKDESGSYYKTVGETESFEGSASKVNAVIKKRGHQQFTELVGSRSA